jgi:hypothetical protein
MARIWSSSSTSSPLTRSSSVSVRSRSRSGRDRGWSLGVDRGHGGARTRPCRAQLAATTRTGLHKFHRPGSPTGAVSP